MVAVGGLVLGASATVDMCPIMVHLKDNNHPYNKPPPKSPSQKSTSQMVPLNLSYPEQLYLVVVSRVVGDC